MSSWSVQARSWQGLLDPNIHIQLQTHPGFNVTVPQASSYNNELVCKSKVQVSIRKGTLGSLKAFWGKTHAFHLNCTLKKKKTERKKTTQIARWIYQDLGAGLVLIQPRVLNFCVHQGHNNSIADYLCEKLRKDIPQAAWERWLSPPASTCLPWMW